jgi:hypothetical protein
VHDIAAAHDLGVEPAVHVEKQVLEAALRHHNLEARGEKRGLRRTLPSMLI